MDAKLLCAVDISWLSLFVFLVSYVISMICEEWVCFVCYLKCIDWCSLGSRATKHVVQLHLYRSQDGEISLFCHKSWKLKCLCVTACNVHGFSWDCSLHCFQHTWLLRVLHAKCLLHATENVLLVCDMGLGGRARASCALALCGKQNISLTFFCWVFYFFIFLNQENFQKLKAQFGAIWKWVQVHPFFQPNFFSTKKMTKKLWFACVLLFCNKFLIVGAFQLQWFLAPSNANGYSVDGKSGLHALWDVSSNLLQVLWTYSFCLLLFLQFFSFFLFFFLLFQMVGSLVSLVFFHLTACGIPLCPRLV